MQICWIWQTHSIKSIFNKPSIVVLSNKRNLPKTATARRSNASRFLSRGAADCIIYTHRHFPLHLPQHLKIFFDCASPIKCYKYALTQSTEYTKYIQSGHATFTPAPSHTAFQNTTHSPTHIHTRTQTSHVHLIYSHTHTYFIWCEMWVYCVSRIIYRHLSRLIFLPSYTKSTPWRMDWSETLELGDSIDLGSLYSGKVHKSAYIANNRIEFSDGFNDFYEINVCRINFKTILNIIDFQLRLPTFNFREIQLIWTSLWAS